MFAYFKLRSIHPGELIDDKIKSPIFDSSDDTTTMIVDGDCKKTKQQPMPNYPSIATVSSTTKLTQLEATGIGKSVHIDQSTDWRSVRLMAFILFLLKMQFSVFFASIWPYMQEVDHDSDQRMYGYVTAIYSIGTALSAPLFGYWSNRAGQTRLPAIVGMIMMLGANLLYALVQCFSMHRQIVILIARLAVGIAAGSVGIMYAYPATASSSADRSTAMAITDGAFALGIAFGPIFQMAFTPLGYPGVQLFGLISLNMYTAPAYVANAMVLIALVVIWLFFKENHSAIASANVMHDRFYAVPKYDRLAIALCMLLKFAQMFIYANIETIGSPYSMIIFEWTRTQATVFNSLSVSITGFISFAFLIVYVWKKIGQNLSNRVGLLIGLIACLAFHIVTYPWSFYPKKIEFHYSVVNEKNISEQVGCSPTLDWCRSTSAVNVWLYNSLYVMLFGIAFPLINVHLASLYSQILGPRRQGTMQGFNILISSIARIVGPVFITYIFTIYGPKLVWCMEIGLLIFVLASYGILYRRMVPMKTVGQLVAGDKIKYKHGWIYRF